MLLWIKQYSILARGWEIEERNFRIFLQFLSNCFLLVHLVCLITQPISGGDAERFFSQCSTNWMTMSTCLWFMIHGDIEGRLLGMPCTQCEVLDVGKYSDPTFGPFWFHTGVFLASYAFGMWHI